MNLRNSIRSLLLLTVLGWTGVISAYATIRTDFEAANKLFEERKFSEAAGEYEKLVAAGNVSAALYFNLGNAYFKSGQMGRAIVAYHQAGRLAPRDSDIQANLRFARNQVQGPTLRATRWQSALKLLSLNEWASLTAVTFWLTFGSLAAMQFRPAWKSGLRSVVLGAAAATVVLTICLISAVKHDAATDIAIVAKSDTMVRNGPFDASPSAFTAQDGAELRIIDRKDDWLQVTDDGRHNGWVKENAVLFASPKR